MLSQLFVFHKSKNFTSDYEIRMPPTVPVNHYSDPEGQHNRIRILWCYPMLMYPERRLALSTLISSKLALQWILVKGFRLYSFQLPDSMSPPFLRLPLRNRTLILRHPSPPWINQVASIRVAPAPARVGRLCSSLPHTRPSHIADRESSKVGSTGNVIAHPRKGGNERDACLTVRCTGHGASQQQHPHYNSHTLAFQPVSSAFLLPNTAREDGFDGEATGMSRCLPSGAHVCPQSETHTHDESHIFLPECIRDWVLGWCCVCMAQIFPRSHQARVSTRLTRVVFQLPKIIQADHDAKMVEGEPTQ
ncbi:hypothetical protein VNO80_31689 [Phaseolus coccineus]|uniref:Uncharacterized protein n=1 Tax=Phaseolus coccineus TaxID=3886 RepID=A0AAN9Q715_PHACN